jgi:hypothetical protein
VTMTLKLTISKFVTVVALAAVTPALSAVPAAAQSTIQGSAYHAPAKRTVRNSYAATTAPEQAPRNCGLGLMNIGLTCSSSN